jgi:hypothetical protein
VLPDAGARAPRAHGRELEATLTAEELAHVVLFANSWLQRALFAVGSRCPTRLKETYFDGLVRLLT